MFEKSVGILYDLCMKFLALHFRLYFPLSLSLYILFAPFLSDPTRNLLKATQLCSTDALLEESHKRFPGLEVDEVLPLELSCR